jgi:hypothetical protein
LNQSSGKKNSLLLTARELADLAMRILHKTNSIERFHRLAPVRRADGPKPANASIETHARDIERANRKVPINALSLRNVANATSRFPVRFSKQPHGA